LVQAGFASYRCLKDAETWVTGPQRTCDGLGDVAGSTSCKSKSPSRSVQMRRSSIIRRTRCSRSKSLNSAKSAQWSLCQTKPGTYIAMQKCTSRIQRFNGSLKVGSSTERCLQLCFATSRPTPITSSVPGRVRITVLTGGTRKKTVQIDWPCEPVMSLGLVTT
jgi:hypothetical protein